MFNIKGIRDLAQVFQQAIGAEPQQPQGFTTQQLGVPKMYEDRSFDSSPGLRYISNNDSPGLGFTRLQNGATPLYEDASFSGSPQSFTREQIGVFPLQNSNYIGTNPGLSPLSSDGAFQSRLDAIMKQLGGQ